MNDININAAIALLTARGNYCLQKEIAKYFASPLDNR